MEQGVVLRIKLQTRQGDNLAGVQLEISPADRELSIEQFCMRFMYPALSQLGWKMTPKSDAR